MPRPSRNSSPSITEGTVEPSDHAYVDTFLHPIDIHRNHISVSTVQKEKKETNVDAGSLKSSSCTIFRHELLYKGDVCWRLETKYHHQGSDHQKCSSKCDIVKGQLVIKTCITTRKLFWKSRKVKTSDHDVAAMIQGAAVAYNSYAAEEELGLINDQILEHQDDQDNAEITSKYNTGDKGAIWDQVESILAKKRVKERTEEASPYSCYGNQDATRATFNYKCVVDNDDALLQQMKMAKQEKYGALGGMTCV